MVLLPASGNGSIAVAGAQRVTCSVPLSSQVTPAGVVWSSLWRAAAGEGAEAHDLQSGEVFDACRSGRRRWGARSAVRRRGEVFLGACRRERRRGGLQLYKFQAAWGATGQLSGIWLGLWVSASGGALDLPSPKGDFMAIYELITRPTLEELAALMDTLPASHGPAVGRLLRFEPTALPLPPTTFSQRGRPSHHRGGQP